MAAAPVAGRDHGEVQVRRARPADADEIAEIHVRSWQATYRGHIADAYLDALRAPERAPVIRRWLDDPGWYVLEDEGRVVGFAQAAGSRDDDAPDGTAEVTTIYLDPSAWRQGGGRALLRRVTSDLAAQGFAEATLWVLDGNDAARRFYEALGWLPDGTTKTVSVGEQELTEVRYRCPL